MDTLADRVAAASFRAIGAQEHLQIAGLIRGATSHVVDRDAAIAVRDALDEHTWSVESNLDLIPMPQGAAWYEWPLPTRVGHGGGDAARTGCLAVPHPEVDNLLMVVTAWESLGIAMHSFGIAMIDMVELQIHAAAARRLYSKDRIESLTRIMSKVDAFVPQSFMEEISILSDGNEQAADAAMRDATSEVPFLLALLLALNASGGIVVREEDGVLRGILPDTGRRKGFAGVMDGLLKRPVGSFVRTGASEAAWIRG